MPGSEVVALVPAPSELEMQRVIVEPTRVLVIAQARHPAASCPACGSSSARVHSHYHRQLADLPWHGLAVALRVQVRRFVCERPQCARRIFCERLPATACVHARRTTRLTSALELIGLALGGEAGHRLAHSLGMAAGTSADTLLRVLKTPLTEAPASDVPPVRVLGVDDWAWRKGHRYGTILVDLERHRVLDLLADREPDTLVAWLQAHPGIEIVSRDRASAYAEAATRGAPDAIQVADRFHLLHNLTDAVQHALERHQRAVRTALALPEPTARTPAKRGGAVGQPASRPLRPARLKAATRERRLAKYEQVTALHACGLCVVAINRQTGVSRATITRWLRAERFPERRPATQRSTTLDAHAAYLRQRWAEGCHNATRLWRELRAQHGFHGGVSTVRDWIAQHVRGRARGVPDAAPPRMAHPSPRRAAWLLTKAADALTDEERAYTDAVCTACPALATVRALAADFRRMLTTKDVNALHPWLAAAERSDLRSLAVGLRRDHDAVLAAICFRWSNGQVEGQVNRLKLIKRTMYGRASYSLLRRRILAA
jgi:transposase